MKYFEYEDNTLTLDFKSEIAKNFYNDYLTFKCSFDISLDFLNQENYFNFNILEKEYKKLLKEFERAINYLKDKYPEISEKACETALKYNWQDFCDRFFDEILYNN